MDKGQTTEVSKFQESEDSIVLITSLLWCRYRVLFVGSNPTAEDYLAEMLATFRKYLCAMKSKVVRRPHYIHSGL